ncbi:MAG TPA: helix-turn-helix domain-containing protein [Verrucomicrobiae bacterium]|nr:helix-turn-helix domain-containing protein [Verrucomicrobiae bacterium]
MKDLTALLDRLDAGVLITDKLGRVLFANATFRKLSGAGAGNGLPKSRSQELQALLERAMSPIARGTNLGAYRDQERAHILAALNETGGKIYGANGAAALLGMPPTTLVSRLRKYGIPPKRRRTIPPARVEPTVPEPEPEMLD